MIIFKSIYIKYPYTNNTQLIYGYYQNRLLCSKIILHELRTHFNTRNWAVGFTFFIGLYCVRLVIFISNHL